MIFWYDCEEWGEAPISHLDISKLPAIWSVSEATIYLAIYAWFKEIYLLGIDHDWLKGPLIYFYNEKTEHLMKPDKDRLPFADAEYQMHRHAYIFHKYKCLYTLKENIYNANADKDHYMDVSPKVDYDALCNY